jgi:hypothetical protein
MNQDDADTEAALGAYGDAVEMAVRVPTLTGVLFALVTITVVWAWRHARRSPQSVR